MGNGVIKTIILGIILVVMAFVLGSLASDGTKSPLMIIGAFCGLCCLVYLGKRCWCLLYILPPVLSFLELPLLSRVPISYILAFVILAYWLVLWAMGYVRITWNGVAWMDCIVLVAFLYMAVSYYRHPVSIAALGLDVDEVGGEAYFFAATAAVYYVTLSLIPLTMKEVLKTLKLSYHIIFVLAFLGLLVSLSDKGVVANMGSAMEEGRYGLFSGVANFISTSLFCAYPLTLILTSPWRLFALMFAYVGCALCGFRSVFMGMLVPQVVMCFIWKQLRYLLLLGGLGYAVLYYAGQERVLDSLPFGIQRSLSAIPGVRVDPYVANDARHSTEWRKQLWRWALDPRTGYIKDYVWGDGFAQSLTEIKRESIHDWRPSMKKYDKTLFFAERGVWHSAPIVWIHRLGIVGLVVMTICSFAGCLLLLRIFWVVRYMKGGFFIMYFTVGYITAVAMNILAVGDGKIIFGLFTTITMIKVVYSLMQKEGLMPPMFMRRIYVPMAVREHEEEMLAKRQRPVFLPRKGEM